MENGAHPMARAQWVSIWGRYSGVPGIQIRFCIYVCRSAMVIGLAKFSAVFCQWFRFHFRFSWTMGVFPHFGHFVSIWCLVFWFGRQRRVPWVFEMVEIEFSDQKQATRVVSPVSGVWTRFRTIVDSLVAWLTSTGNACRGS